MKKSQTQRFQLSREAIRRLDHPQPSGHNDAATVTVTRIVTGCLPVPCQHS